MEVAFEEVQVRLLIWPAVIVDGSAVNVTVGALDGLTVTVTVAVDWPPFAPVAVRV